MQNRFAFRETGASRLRAGEIVVDLFAGGGGASEALRQALGRDPDIAINHDAWAIGMHSANHPFTRHLTEDVWHAEPRRLVGARRVGWMHASPDCTHFSQAKGGQPRSRATRALSWVVLKWAGTVAPRIISLENVEQILKWCPLVAKRDRATGRVLRLDGSVAALGERVPIGEQFLIPDARRTGRTWRQFVAALRELGYVVEWRKLRACDFGAGTSRTRLFMIARRDGEQICWPTPSHAERSVCEIAQVGKLRPFVTAADCIDWSIPCPSIFTRKKPLAEATLRRIAKGTKRFVIDAAEPFIVPVTHGGDDRVHGVREPLRTVTAAHRGEFMLAAPILVPRYGERDGQDPRALDAAAPMPTIVPTGNGGGVALAHLVKFRGDSAGRPVDEPLPTITSGAGAARPAGHAHALGVITAYMEQANGGPNGHAAKDRAADEPLSTIVGKGCTQRLVTAHLMHASTSNTNGGRGCPDLPLRTILAGGEHNAIVECTLSEEHEAGALRVAAFLMRYHGEGGQWGELDQPADTITTKHRLALVTVTIRGTPYVIVDIGLRMLKPPELFAAQGFPRDYIIDRTADGRRITGTRAVRMVGNSVSPPPLRALATANLDPFDLERREAA